MTGLKKLSDSLYRLVSLNSENLKKKVERCSCNYIILEISIFLRQQVLV